MMPVPMSAPQLFRLFVTIYFGVFLFAPKTALAAESLKKVRVAFPSIVIDFAPLWIAREKGEITAAALLTIEDCNVRDVATRQEDSASV